MKQHHIKAKHIKTNASKRLQLNLRILGIVYLILFAITGYSVVVSQAIFWQVLLAIIIGVLAGVVSARMYKITWNKHEAEVIGRIDIYGAVVLVLFIIFELNRTQIAQIFSSGESIGAIGLVLITGALFGRIFGTARRILQVLEEEKII